MALLKNKMTARANESQMPWNLNLPVVVAEECDATSAMLEKLMDESWEWEQKFLASEKKRLAEFAFNETLHGKFTVKKLVKTLDQERYQIMRDLEQYHYQNRGRSANPLRGAVKYAWAKFRKICAICDGATDLDLLEGGIFRPIRTPEGGLEADLAPKLCEVKQYDYGRTTRDLPPSEQDFTCEFYLEHVEGLIKEVIRLEVNTMWKKGRKLIITDWVKETPGYRRAQARVIATNIARGETRRDKRDRWTKLTVKQMKWLADILNVPEDMLKGKKKSELQVIIPEVIRNMVNFRDEKLYEKDGNFAMIRPEIGEVREWRWDPNNYTIWIDYEECRDGGEAYRYDEDR